MTDDAKKDAQLEARFWKEIRDDMTVMLGLGSEIEYRPMTAQFATKEDHGPAWFFTSTDTDLGRHVRDGGAQQSSFHFVSKGHDIWATVSGMLQVDQNRAMIDQLWNPYVSAWYEGGKDDPKLLLLRMEREQVAGPGQDVGGGLVPGDEEGLDFIPQKLRSLLEVNQILSHQPWLLTKDHIAVRARNELFFSWFFLFFLTQSFVCFWIIQDVQDVKNW